VTFLINKFNQGIYLILVIIYHFITFHGEVTLAIVNKKTLRKLIFTCQEPQHTSLENDEVARSLVLSTNAPITFIIIIIIIICLLIKLPNHP